MCGLLEGERVVGAAGFGAEVLGGLRGERDFCDSCVGCLDGVGVGKLLERKLEARGGGRGGSGEAGKGHARREGALVVH